MGAGSFNIDEYETQAKAAVISENAGFQATSMKEAFNPANVTTRFSKRGPFNHFKDPITILVGLDVTGSMDVIPKALLTGKLGSLMVDLQNEFNRPNENLQLSFAGIGDAKSDEAPLQVTHFESDNRFAQHLPKIWLEGHGGANGGESYNLLWWYAANKTHLNYAQHDGRKGILITIGDDNVHPNLTAFEIQMWLDPHYDGGDISNEVLLQTVREQYDVYHIVVTDGHAYGYDYLQSANKTAAQKTTEAEQWRGLLGPDHVIDTVADGVADVIADIVKRHRPAHEADMATLTPEEWKVETLSNLTNEQWQDVLSYTLCPLSREYMRHPVVWGDSKRAYKKQAVLDYVSEHHRDPITQEAVRSLLVKPNMNIAQVCMDYQTYFDALPDERKAHLIDLTLSTDAAEHIERGSTSSTLFSTGASTSAAPQASIAQATPDTDDTKALLCPISLEIMTDPVILAGTGQTYDRESIVAWLANNNTDPSTNTVLTEAGKALIPNYALKSLCDSARANAMGTP